MFLRVSSLRCASHVESNLAPCLPLPRPSTRCGVVNQQKAGLWRFGRLGEDGGGCVRCGATSPVLHNLPTLHNLPRGLQPSRPTSQYVKASPVWRGRNTTPPPPGANPPAGILGEPGSPPRPAETACNPPRARRHSGGRRAGHEI